MTDRDARRSSSGGRKLLAAALVVLVLLALAWTLRAGDAADQAPAPVAAPSTGFDGSPSPFARAASGAPTTPEPPAAPAPAEDEVPEGVDPAQWRAVLDSLVGHPQREAELERIGAFMRFAAQLERFRALREAGTPAPQLTALALDLDAGLDERIERGEVLDDEASAIRAALREILPADAGSR